jgi:hypothetical protein
MKPFLWYCCVMSLPNGSIVNNVFSILFKKRVLFLTQPEFLVDFMNNMIIRIHGFEILNAQLVPLIGSLRKYSCLLLFIMLPRRIPQLLWIFLQCILRLEV